MHLKIITKIQLVILLIASTLLIQCKTFHIATKIRSKPLCGTKLIDKVLNQCIKSVETNVPNMLTQKMELEDQNHTPDDNSICCQGIACNSDVIRQYCDFWLFQIYGSRKTPGAYTTLTAPKSKLDESITPDISLQNNKDIEIPNLVSFSSTERDKFPDKRNPPKSYIEKLIKNIERLSESLQKLNEQSVNNDDENSSIDVYNFYQLEYPRISGPNEHLEKGILAPRQSKYDTKPLKKDVMIPMLRTKKHQDPLMITSTVTEHPEYKRSTLKRLFLSTRPRRSPLTLISNTDGMDYTSMNANNNYTSSVSHASYYPVRLPFFHVYDQ